VSGGEEGRRINQSSGALVKTQVPHCSSAQPLPHRYPPHLQLHKNNFPALQRVTLAVSNQHHLSLDLCWL
jgi:hypothetical protein